MSISGPNNVERAVQTDPTILRYASAITEQNNVAGCWPMLLPFTRRLREYYPLKFLFPFCSNNCARQDMLRYFASVCTYM